MPSARNSERELTQRQGKNPTPNGGNGRMRERKLSSEEGEEFQFEILEFSGIQRQADAKAQRTTRGANGR